ncbi:MAG: lantibiotic dehydratase [Kofleriaceae bacterium]
MVRAGDVTLWRDCCLRGTGFPTRLLLGAAAEDSVRLIDAALETERAGGPRWIEARTAIETAFNADWRRVAVHLRDVAGSALFREALLWQNRAGLLRGVDALARRPAGATDTRTRVRERMVASYLQRYCAKNDTIGFFGPVGWATLREDQATTLQLVPGRTLVDRRTVYFEHWAIDTLAARLSDDRALRTTLPPRRMPTVWLDGDRLHHPVDRVSVLAAATAALIERCDGERSARAIANELVSVPALELDSVEDVYDLLDELVAARIILWRLEVPTGGLHPEGWLQQALAAVEPTPAGEAAKRALQQLEDARDVVAGARHADELDLALGTLEETFVRLTAVPAARRAGEIYASRGIIYEDCRRDVSVSVGIPFLERIGPQLALIQTSARWYTHSIASGFRMLFERHYRALVAEVGSSEVDLIRFYLAVRPELVTEDRSIVPTVLAAREELQRRWAEILALPPDQRRVERRVADLAPRMGAAFSAPSPGWPLARHCSPDLMIAAAGPEAFARGDFLVVLGEVHAGMNTIAMPALAKEHPDPDRLHQHRRQDVGRSVEWVEALGKVHRGSVYSLAKDDIDIELGDARSHRPRSEVFDMAGFVVVERDGQLWARRRDGTLELDLVAFLQKDLMNESFNFDMFAKVAHRPRVTIDGFVFAREQWRFDAADLAFTGLAAPLDRFVGARRWSLQHELPRYMFVKAPNEMKPMYLDLASPVYVEIFCKLVRANETIVVTEMLPTLDQAWLVDAAGDTYCSELRIVMVDDAEFSSVTTATTA